MTARLSLYEKAEQELYKLDRSVKGKFYDFCHRFRQDPDHPGLDLLPLKGDGRVYRAKIDQSYRALLAKIGIDGAGREKWLVVAVRHRKHVYEELSVAINRITGEIEFVDLSVVGQSVLQRAGMTLTPAEQPEAADEPKTSAPEPATAEPLGDGGAVPEVEPLLSGLTAEELRDLGVAEQLIDLALAVTESTELDALVSGAPLLTKDILYGLAVGLSIADVRKEITAPVDVELDESERNDLNAALARTTVTTIDDALKDIIEEGDFRAWKVFLHPAQAKLVDRRYSGPFRVSGGPGTGKTIVALHRVKYLAEQLPASTTTSRSCSPPSPRTSPPTCAPACPPCSNPNCWPASTSRTSTSSPPASSTRTPSPVPESSASTTASHWALSARSFWNSTRNGGTRSSSTRNGSR